MKANRKVYCAVAAILGAHAAAIRAATPADTPSDADSGAIGEVVVTAQRRTENSQDVPITIQALTAQTLTQLNVSTFEDFVKYLPNVSTAGYGPGQDLIFMRGLSVGVLGAQGSGTDAPFPNVAVYLDDQTAQMPYRNLDVYAVDLERVEVLEGPQGTLFGAGAEAGAVRYITNKPKLDVTEGNVNAGYGYTAHGDHNSNVDATLNLPLIPDTLAVRGVVYNDSRGGYINNVPGTFTRQLTDVGIGKYVGGIVPPGSAPINNQNQVANAINPVTYQGIRVEALWKINDDWDALVSQSYQDINAQGVFYQEPRSTDGVPLPTLSVTTFNPAYNKDRFEDTSLTINGRVGDLKLVYTGGYLVRNVDAQADYTAYSRGVYADYYQCVSPKESAKDGAPVHCNSPSAYWHDTERNTHQSHELRLSTPDDWQLRGIVGAYWEKFYIQDNQDWFYKSLPACSVTVTAGCLTDINPPAGTLALDPGLRPDNESFFDEVQRAYRQYAFFTSVDYDIIPKVLTVTGGTRYYNFKNTETGSNVYSFDTYDCGPAPCAAEDANNISKLDLHTTYSGFKSRGNLSWKVTSDALLYYTWSQGYRPGGFNRSIKGPYIGGDYLTPQAYTPDSLTNNEVGWKTEWFDHSLQFNGAVYQEDWKNVQLQFFDPGATGNLSYITNGANYRVRGAETQIVWRATQGLTLQAGASYNDSRQTNSPYLIGNVPGSPLFGQPLISAPNPYGKEGSRLAQSPLFQGNVRARYDWIITEYKAFVQVGATHTGSSLSATGSVPTIAPINDVTTQAFPQPGYTTYDASLGVAKDNWTVQVVGHNITDTRGITFISASEAIETQSVIRPRTVGLVFGWKF